MANATDHLQRERAMLLEGAQVPRLGKRLRNRPVVVVSKTFGWQTDLRRIKRWIREHDPVLIGVADGADALLDAGYKPQVVLGTLDELSARAFHCGALVVVTATSAHDKGGAERFEKAKVDPVWFIATGSATDLAIVLADSNEAPVIVEVGAPQGLMEFLERGSADVASSFVTRLRAGSRLVDAKAAGHFAAQATPMWPVLLLLLAGAVAVVTAVAVTPVGGDWFDSARPIHRRRTHLDRRTLLVISFRYHLVSIAAVLLALAAGVALGAGPLDDNTVLSGNSSDSGTSADPAIARFESGYAARTSGALAQGRAQGPVRRRPDAAGCARRGDEGRPRRSREGRRRRHR